MRLLLCVLFLLSATSAHAQYANHSLGLSGGYMRFAEDSQLEPGLAIGRQAMGFHMQLRLMLRRLRTKTTARLLPAAPRPARASSGQARALTVPIMPRSSCSRMWQW